MVINPLNSTIDIFYETEKWKVGVFSETSKIDISNSNDVFGELRNSTPASIISYSSLLKARNAKFVFVANNPYDITLSSDTISEIEKAVLNLTGKDAELLNEFLLTLKKTHAANSKKDHVYANTIGLQFCIRDDAKDVASFSIKGKVYDVKVESSQYKRIVFTPKPSANTSSNVVSFISEFEHISVPLVSNEKNSDADIKRYMEFVCNRLEFKDRINGEYFVITGHVPDDEIEQLRFHISLAQVEPMKTQDMQWFFRCPQKSNALIDTFNICVAHASDSHLKNVPIGKKFLIELSQKGAVQVPHKVVPVDYVLLMAPYLKVCATDTLSNGNIRMAVKVLSDKNGDFNQILFSSMSAEQKTTIACFNFDLVENIISSI